MSNLLLDRLPDAIFQLDTFGIITYCNPAAQQLTGYKKTMLIGKPIQFLTQEPADNIKSSYQLSSALSTGKMLLHGWNLRADGGLYWAETTVAPLYQNQEHCSGFACIIRDITERKNEEIALRRNEERFRLLVEGILDYSIYMLDVYGRIVTWNEGAQQLTGYRSSEITGKHFSIFYNSNDLLDNKPAAELETARRTGRYEEEGWRKKKDGSVFWASIILTAIYNEENELIGFSNITKDLTEQNLELAALRQNEEMYRLLVEQVTDYGIFMMDEKGRIVSWNEGAKRIKGFEATDIIGKYFAIFYPPEEIHNGKPAYELKIARQQGKYEEEGWRIRKDGSKFWANVVITAVYNTDRVLVGFSKVTRDLTERKQAEQIAMKNSEKDRQTAREMGKINAELSRTNYDLEQFTSILSHDLLEPLRTVKSFLHLINQKIEMGHSEPILPYIIKSIQAADRMKELIENVLNYSQVSKGQINKGNWLVSEVLANVTQNLKGNLDDSGASILLNVNKDVTIQGDIVQLTQLFQNLISNAIKFTSEKPPIITIKLINDRGYPVFSVSDNGIGMDPESSLKIFDPFRRLHTALPYSGAGMGLAICKRVVERHQGKIWVESQTGKGSTFYFSLWETTQNHPHYHEPL